MNFEISKTGTSGRGNSRRLETHSWRRKSSVASEKPKGTKEMVPFYVTVMGNGGKILLNIYKNKAGKNDVQLFMNKGLYNDGIQLVRSCLKNMLSREFDRIVALNVYNGFFLAVQTEHDNIDVHTYQAHVRYSSNIGHLEYVHIENIREYADMHNASVNAKVLQYVEVLKKYIDVSREITGAFAE